MLIQKLIVLCNTEGTYQERVLLYHGGKSILYTEKNLIHQSDNNFNSNSRFSFLLYQHYYKILL
jgi:hypothetical protein